MCLGAGLARSKIFLFFTAILQQFCLLPVGSPTNIDLTPQCTGLGNIPPAFQLRLVARCGRAQLPSAHRLPDLLSPFGQ